MDVRVKKFPNKIQDMLGYQTLIVEARMEYEGDGWLGYDRRFRQTAATSPDTPWSKIELTLWNKAFAGQARASRCKYCFSLTHTAEDCDWAPTPSTSRANKQVAPVGVPIQHRFATSGTTPHCQRAPSQIVNIGMSAGIVVVIRERP